jgi:hypothetical protein
MTQLLQQAIAELQKLSATDQDALASLILAEISEEQRWEDAFAGSQPQLSKLAEKVRSDIRAGRVRDAGMGTL